MRHDDRDGDLYDERGDELDSRALQLYDLGGRVAFDGPIRTVRCHRDKSAKAGVGEVDVPVTIAGAVFAPGRHVWADADGVLVER